MKVLNKPVSVLAVFDAGKNRPRPYKIKFEDKRSELVRINVDEVLQVETLNYGDARMLEYSCQSVINGKLRRFVLRYHMKDTCWELYKI